MERIGIVGTGRMGAGIARHLNDVGYVVAAVHDACPQSAAETAAAVNATVCEHLADVTRRCDVIITVVTDDRAMNEIFAEAPNSLLAECGGKVFINCATVTPDIHVEIERRCEQRGASALEACMASSIPHARSGELYLIVGGRRQTFERAVDILNALGSTVRYVGESGRAAQVKALVNMVMNINTAGLAEGLGLGAALDLDGDMLREIFAHTGAASRVLETDGADMQHREHDTYFSAEHAAKDSGIALALAAAAHLRLPLAQAAFHQYERMKALGLGGLDKSGIAELTFKDRHADP